MKKLEFLARLRQQLFALSPRETEETLAYYSEMIDDYIENGYTVEEALACIGTPESVAAQILASAQNPFYSVPCAQNRKKSGFAIAMLIIGFPLWFSLLLTAFCVVLTLAIVLATLAIVLPWSLVVAFGASSIGLLIASAAVLVGEGIAAGLLVLGAAFVLAALCIFTLWCALRLTTLAAKGIGAMFRGSFNLIFGRRNRR